MQVSITDQEIFTALRNFLLSIVPSGTEVVQAQDNGVPMPKGAFVAMNNVGSNRLSFNVDTYDSLNQLKMVKTPIEYSIQADFYGADAATWANAAQSLFRDDYAFQMFPSEIKPLHADGPIQMPLISGEQQYIQRWRLVCKIQYNPIISLSQQSATQLKFSLTEVDSRFRP